MRRKTRRESIGSYICVYVYAYMYLCIYIYSDKDSKDGDEHTQKGVQEEEKAENLKGEEKKGGEVSSKE